MATERAVLMQEVATGIKRLSEADKWNGQFGSKPWEECSARVVLAELADLLKEGQWAE